MASRILSSVRWAAVAALFLGACYASTQVDQAWVSPNKPAMHNVVTMYVGESVTLKHSAEDNLARDLRAQGILASPAYAILGDNITDVDQAKAELAHRGYDGLFTMKILDRQQTFETYPYDGYYWGYGYWGYGYSGYGYTTTTYRLETSAYDLSSGRVVWSAMTTTTDPSNSRSLIRQTSEVVSTRFARGPGAG